MTDTSSAMFLLAFCLIQLASASVTVKPKVYYDDRWYVQSAPHKISDVGKRSGSPTKTHSCDSVRSVPSHLTFITRYNFYRKYTEAYGIPIIGSQRVSDAAIKRACYVIRFLLADREDLRRGVFKNFGRFGVIALNEQTTTIPEFSHLPNWWNTRARGLGGVLGRPISTGGEENVLCLSKDRYRGDDIFFHESAHNVAEVGLAGGLPRMYQRLGRLYQSARSRGLWRNTYAMTDQREYFAEGLQSYFNCHIEGPTPSNGVHGSVNTREELRRYDSGLYNFIKELYPCNNVYQMCTKNPTEPIRMDCDGSSPSTTTLPPPPGITTTTKRPTTKCTDKNKYCYSWSRYGHCSSNIYVKNNCKRSCGTC